MSDNGIGPVSDRNNCWNCRYCGSVMFDSVCNRIKVRGNEILKKIVMAIAAVAAIAGIAITAICMPKDRID